MPSVSAAGHRFPAQAPRPRDEDAPTAAGAVTYGEGGAPTPRPRATCVSSAGGSDVPSAYWASSSALLTIDLRNAWLLAVLRSRSRINSVIATVSSCSRLLRSTHTLRNSSSVSRDRKSVV